MDKHDRIAMTLALTMARAESPGRAQQIDDKLRDEPWEKVGLFAASLCQRKALRLEPWRDPPCDGNAAAEWRDPDAEKLLQEMLAVGVSRFDPDPVQAIEAKRKGAT